MKLSELIPLGMAVLVKKKKAAKRKGGESPASKHHKEFCSYDVAMTLMTYSLQPGDIILYGGRKLKILDEYSGQNVVTQELYMDGSDGERFELREYYISRSRKWVPPVAKSKAQEELEHMQAISNLMPTI
nr:hypothetical protein [uncultured Arsenicibacter sp.]